MSHKKKDQLTWVPCVLSQANLNLSRPPTLYLLPGEMLTWEQLNGPLRIRMHHGSVIDNCRFGDAVQIDVPKQKPRPGVEQATIRQSCFSGAKTTFKYPKPLS